MPELPEVETVRTGLEAAIKGATIAKVTLRRGNLRTPFPQEFSEGLAGRRITRIERRAKYLLFTLDSDDVLVAHLGMTGRFSVEEKLPKSLSTHDHVVFELKDKRVVIFNDARRFGLMNIVKKADLEKDPLFAELGPEPLGRDFSAAYLKKALAKRSGPIKPVLMDQKLVVGVGNIYASEALFLAGIDPKKAASGTVGKVDKIIDSIHRVLEDAIDSGGSSLRDFVQLSGETGYFQHHFKVYGRKGEPCFTCKNPIRAIKQAGRSTFYCPRCQK